MIEGFSWDDAESLCKSYEVVKECGKLDENSKVVFERLKEALRIRKVSRQEGWRVKFEDAYREARLIESCRKHASKLEAEYFVKVVMDRLAIKYFKDHGGDPVGDLRNFLMFNRRATEENKRLLKDFEYFIASEKEKKLRLDH